MKWLALDIGGANLKIADGDQFAHSHPFPLWKKSAHLAETLRMLLAMVPRVDHLAVTMTGELADCFATKAEGVAAILHAVQTAADGRHTRVYMTSGALVTVQVALRQPLLAASSNWHALARFAGRFAKEGNGLMIDIGSTTCDLIPLVKGSPVTIGRTDPMRLLNGELIYTGVERSPVCSIVAGLPWRGKKCPTAQELFATTWDVYLTLGDLPEEPKSVHTADGRPATKACARDRLARMICADSEMFSENDARAAAEAVAMAQLRKMSTVAAAVLDRLSSPVETAVVSGRGEFLARRLIAALAITPKIVSLSSELGPVLSQCAAAHALAVLAREGH